MSSTTFGSYTGYGDTDYGTNQPTGWGQQAADTYEAAAETAPEPPVEDSPDETADEQGTRETGGRRGRRQADRALIRRVSAKTVELSQAPDRQRRILASLLGGRDDVVALTTAVMTAERSALSPLSSLLQVLDAEGELDRAITVMGLSTEGKLKDVWGVLVAADLVTGSLPSSDDKATKHFVSRLAGLDETQLRADIAAVSELAKRW